MNQYFDTKFERKEAVYRRNYDIDESLYSQLEELSKYYAAYVTDLINASIKKLIQTEKIALYEKRRDVLSIRHSLLVKESNLKGLDKLKDKYGVSISKLVNIAIKNTLEDEGNE